MEKQTITFEEISNKISKDDRRIIYKIARLAVKRYKDAGIEQSLVSLKMDLIAVHGHCCYLDLNKLLKFDNFNFFHDIEGIIENLDRRKISLKNYFLPRSAI